MIRAVRLAVVLVSVIATVATLLLLVSFAIPVPLWRTGEHPAQPLRYRVAASPTPSEVPIWVDTDAACGSGAYRDPDDCLAVLSLVRRQRTRLAGMSTVYGNAPIEITDATARALAEVTRLDPEGVPILRGCSTELSTCRGDGAERAAVDALAAALRRGPLTFVALGPLTNLAAALRREPAAASLRVIAVMGRRPGHLFHPSEGRGPGALLFGHGPVFRDLNFSLDPQAVAAVLRSRAELVLLPYSAARNVLMTPSDLDFIAGQGQGGTWVAARSRDWLEFWRRDIGIDGFYPFDLLASAFVDDPSSFRCADVSAWVGSDTRLPLYPRSAAFQVAQDEDPPPGASAVGRALYCDQVARLDLRRLFVRRG